MSDSQSAQRGAAFAAVLTLATPSPSTKKLSLCCVPKEWLINNQVLLYPKGGKSYIEALVKSGSHAGTKPDPKTWTKYAYVVKKRFTSYESAVNYVSANDNNDSDSHEGQIKKLQLIQKSIVEQGM